MRWAKIFLPRLEYIFLAAVLWGIAANGPKMLNLDGDLPRHLLVGRQTLETFHVSTVDVFSYRTVGFLSYPHEWLAQVFLTLSDTVFGLNGVVLLSATIIVLTFAIIYKNARAAASPLISLFFTGLALGTSAIHFLPRPHIFTYLLMAFWIFQMERVSSGNSRRWWLFPVLMLVWVNIHGMFFMGLLIWAAYIVGSMLDEGTEKWRRRPESRLLLVSGLASLPMTFFSPSGAGIWKTILELGSSSYLTSRIPEYQSANFQLPSTWPFILLLVLLLTGLALNPKTISLRYVLLLGGFLILALYSSRMIPLFAIVAAPIAAGAFSEWIKDEKDQSKFTQTERFLQTMEEKSGGAAWLFVTFFVLIGIFASGKTIDPQHKGNSFDPHVFPVAAVDWLQSHPQEGHMLNDFNWGGYILLRTWPEYPIFMDGHTHIYGEALTREYEQLIKTSQGWESIIEKYQAIWAIIPTTSRLAASLTEKGWETIYQDETAVILRNTTVK